MYNPRNSHPLKEALLQLQSSESVVVSKKGPICGGDLLSKDCSTRIQAAQSGCLSVPVGIPSIFGHDPSLYTRQHRETSEEEYMKYFAIKRLTTEKIEGICEVTDPIPLIN